MQKNCPKCRNKEIKLNGKNSQGKQKYKCKKCSYCFVRKDRKNDEIRGTSIFYNRIKEGYSVRQLSDQNSKKNIYIKELIRNELDNNLIYQIDIVFEIVEKIYKKLLLLKTLKMKKCLLKNLIIGKKNTLIF